MHSAPIALAIALAALTVSAAGVQANPLTLQAHKASVLSGAKAPGHVMLNPQPIPPGELVSLNPQPIPPGDFVKLNPQPIPPKEAPRLR